ncbi:MAG TPA: hypothetical protein VFB39_06060 [Solirubrobacteraceae bacterium]|nr:hypothetical protein [Solirubrobacteraceae bacterium]
MWDSPQESVDPRFMVIAHLRPEAGDDGPASPADFTALPRERLIVHGELFTPDEVVPAGLVLALQAPTRAAVDGLLRGGLAGADHRFDVEIHDWEFGGRR